jgi:hypothetical protein
MGELPWYQPVAALHSQGTALAVHPKDLCDDGETLQPIIAVRPYGANGGEVVYIGFNELWRLRRMHGETYYKRFWGNLIKRLALSHALGAQKRFLVRTDRQQYQEGDEVIVTVEAYDENYEPLSAESLPGGLRGELVVPAGGGDRTLSITISQRREGVFEARVPVHVGGEYRLRVRDPVSEQYREARFTVAELSAERRSAVRDEDLQVLIAQDSGGRSYDLTTVSQLVDDLHVERVSELQIQNLRLWHTWLWFGTIVALMLTEWLFRKLNRLP